MVGLLSLRLIRDGIGFIPEEDLQGVEQAVDPGAGLVESAVDDGEVQIVVAEKVRCLLRRDGINFRRGLIESIPDELRGVFDDFPDLTFRNQIDFGQNDCRARHEMIRVVAHEFFGVASHRLRRGVKQYDGVGVLAENLLCLEYVLLTLLVARID